MTSAKYPKGTLANLNSVFSRTYRIGHGYNKCNYTDMEYWQQGTERQYIKLRVI